MATLMIRKIDEKTKRLLREQAARHGRSMEEEARQILRRAVRPTIAPDKGFGKRLFDLARPGIELPDIRDRSPQPAIDL